MADLDNNEIMVNEEPVVGLETSNNTVSVLTRAGIYVLGVATPFIAKGAIWLGKKIYAAVTGKTEEDKPRVK